CSVTFSAVVKIIRLTTIKSRMPFVFFSIWSSILSNLSSGVILCCSFSGPTRLQIRAGNYSNEGSDPSLRDFCDGGPGMLGADIAITNNGHSIGEGGNIGNSSFAHVAQNEAAAMRAREGTLICV